MQDPKWIWVAVFIFLALLYRLISWVTRISEHHLERIGNELTQIRKELGASKRQTLDNADNAPLDADE
jgi:hypothetical protein